MSVLLVKKLKEIQKEISTFTDLQPENLKSESSVQAVFFLPGKNPGKTRTFEIEKKIPRVFSKDRVFPREHLFSRYIHEIQK